MNKTSFVSLMKDKISELPIGFTMVPEKDVLVGEVFMRMSSGFIFRKWKRVFIVVSLNGFMVYQSNQSWESNSIAIAQYAFNDSSRVSSSLLHSRGSFTSQTMSTMEITESIKVISSLNETITNERLKMTKSLSDRSSTQGSRKSSLQLSTPKERRSVALFGSMSSSAVDFLASTINTILSNHTLQSSSRAVSSIVEPEPMSPVQKDKKDRIMVESPSSSSSQQQQQASSTSSFSRPSSIMSKPNKEKNELTNQEVGHFKRDIVIMEVNSTDVFALYC